MEVGIRMTRVDVGWIDPGYVAGHFAWSIASSTADMQYFGIMGQVHRFSTSLPAYGRNIVVDGFLKGDSEWLWFVDSDMVFSKGHVQQLLTTAEGMDAKVVSGLAFIFKDHSQPIPSYFVEDPSGKFYPPGELHLVNKVPDEPLFVSATGLASTLIHRDVFEAMTPPRDEAYRWFDQIHVRNNPRLAGEDVQFFIRAAEAGFPVCLDPKAETFHLKEIGIGRPDFDRYWELRESA